MDNTDYQETTEKGTILGMLFGLGKKRSKLGKWIDKRKISQAILAEESGVSKVTLTRYCNENLSKEKVHRATALKVIRGLRQLTGAEVGIEDFWT